MRGSDLRPRTLSSGLNVAPLGISTGTTRWEFPYRNIDDGQIVRGLRRAIELGARFVDTADAQGGGHAERLIGKVLREYRAHEIHVVSKVGRLRGSAVHPYAGPRVRHQLEQTLENLYQEDLAVYVLDSYDFGAGDRYLGAVVAQMHAMRDLGQIRAIGLRGPTSADSLERVRRFLWLVEEIQPDVVWAQVNGLLPAAVLEGGESLSEFTARKGMGLVIASPLAHGLLAGHHNRRALGILCGHGTCVEAAAAVVERGLRELAGQFGHGRGTLARLALRSRLQRSPHAVVAVGVADEHLVDECFACLSGPLGEDDLAHIDDVLARIRLGIQEVAGDRAIHERVGGIG
ncbi:aldo/keto reductase [Streptomyces cellulosae]|uniref:Aldo/keto reductase n=1 Tax=Streptomyces althioticus TaxID=83380 RepID=A0ABZ1YFS7_9ACTN|nr:aldo/keto reductase [Streptomyces cellulosae]WTB86566.1 aldo/keto reductase [Streptomyces cellulosae]WTB93375.1 aldo/keto reductase [Streptomyces cellulosae]WTC60767.1 aldo/keto reductase [Streptomyces cellulosae]